MNASQNRDQAAANLHAVLVDLIDAIERPATEMPDLAHGLIIDAAVERARSVLQGQRDFVVAMPRAGTPEFQVVWTALQQFADNSEEDEDANRVQIGIARSIADRMGEVFVKAHAVT